MASGYYGSSDSRGSALAAWLYRLYARFLAPWVTGVQLGSWPIYTGTIDLSDPHEALLAQCRTLRAGQVLTFMPVAVAEAYGTAAQAELLLRHDLGDPIGHRYVLEFTSDGGVSVRLRQARLSSNDRRVDDALVRH
jgi:hypothetical protein